MSGVNTNGSSICGSGSRSREPIDLLVLHVVALGAERGSVREVVRLALGDEAVGTLRRRARIVGRRRSTPSGSGAKHSLTTTGPSATPARSSIANAVSITSLTGVSSGSVTSMHLAARRVGEQRDDVRCLLADRPDPHRVEQARVPRAGT